MINKKTNKYFKRLMKSERKMEIEKWRREQAEQGKVFNALFGRPKK